MSETALMETPGLEKHVMIPSGADPEIAYQEAMEKVQEALVAVEEAREAMSETADLEVMAEDLSQEVAQAEHIHQLALRCAQGFRQIYQSGDQVAMVLVNPAIQERFTEALRSLPDHIVPPDFKEKLPIMAEPEIPEIHIVTGLEVETRFLEQLTGFPSPLPAMKSSAPLPTRSTSEEIDCLVKAYRAGDPHAAQELLWRFDRYMKKWVRLLSAGYWDPKDRELGHFLAMMGSVDVHTTAQVLHQRLRAYEAEDLQQEVAVCLLDTALRFGNISAQFRFRLKQRVLELLQDPLTYDISRNLPLEESEEIPAPEEELGPLWIEGLTCGKGFDELTREERLTLLLAKHYGLPIDRVAAILRVSPSTINRTIRRARVVLAGHYLDK